MPLERDFPGAEIHNLGKIHSDAILANDSSLAHFFYNIHPAFDITMAAGAQGLVRMIGFFQMKRQRFPRSLFTAGGGLLAAFVVMHLYATAQQPQSQTKQSPQTVAQTPTPVLRVTTRLV